MIVCVVAPVDHAYDVKPAPASSVTLPPGQTVDGPVIDTVGGVLIVMLFDALPLQPPFVTVTLSVTVPDAPAVKLIAFVPCPTTIAPFVIVHVYVEPATAETLAVAEAPAHMLDAAAIDGAGGAVIGTFAFPLPLHVPVVTVIPSATLPDAPAVKLIAFVPCPLLIAPFVIVHTYVAPACDATLAFALAFAQTLTGAEIVAAAAVLIETDALPLLLQPFALTVTPRETLPVAPAVKLMAFVPWPLLMVPLVIVQLYPAPACDGTLAVADDAGQIDAGAVIVALGGALMGTVALVLVLHPFAVTVRLRTTLPDAPAVNVMALVPRPVLMAPLVMDQE